MRIAIALPLLAAFALIACGGGTDEELADEALSADEVSGAAAGEPTFATPRPGQYRTTQQLVEFSMPSLPADQLGMVRSAFASGAAEPHSYCVTEQMTREEWLSDMAESNCTVSRSTPGAQGIDIELTCNAADGVNGKVAMKGTTSEDAADLEMTFTQTIPGSGDSTIKMRVKSERVGDCA